MACTTENIALAEQNISKARVQLIQNHAFFACLAMRLRFTPADIKTAVTDGIDLRYNPDYFNDLPTEELSGVIAHSVMHLALLHHTRRNSRGPSKWNKAADYAVNPLLREAGLALPSDALDNPEYVGKSAEQVYNMLPDPLPEDNPAGDQDDPGMADVEDPPPQINKQEMEAEMKEAISFASVMARRAGEMTEGIDRFIQQVLKPKVDWKTALARFIIEIRPSDYTWKKPAKRYLHRGLLLPSLEAPEPGELILMVDTSGSISEEALNRVGAEAKDIADSFHIALYVMYIDAKVTGLQHIEPDEPMKLEPKGGGGTDFRPGFDYIETNDLHPKAVVYLTDGCCSSFPDPPEFPVLWTLFEDMKFDPPFGEVLAIE